MNVARVVMQDGGHRVCDECHAGAALRLTPHWRYAELHLCASCWREAVRLVAEALAALATEGRP